MSNNRLIDQIDHTLRTAQSQALDILNQKLLTTNWTLGKLICEAENQGLFDLQQVQQLSDSLAGAHGLHLEKEQLELCRKFYISYPIFPKISMQLNWSHYIELMNLDDELARAFYQRQTEKGNWDTVILKQQMEMGLFENFKNTEHKTQFIEQPLKANSKNNTPKVDIHLQKFINF